ncbi:MAG: hypothetical protein AABX50_01550 [Nanoarchaeota archaeon]
MNIFILLALAAVLIVFIGFRWNKFRTKVAFFFILFGFLLVLFIAFLVVTGSSFDFSDVGSAISSLRVYFLWIKGLVVNVFEITGRAIGLIKN